MNENAGNNSITQVINYQQNNYSSHNTIAPKIHLLGKGLT